MENKNGIRNLNGRRQSIGAIRASVIKTIPLTDSIKIDVVKSNHFEQRDNERGTNGLQVAIDKIIIASVKIAEAWQASGKAKLEGVIKTANNLNIVFSMYNNQLIKGRVDFVLQTIIIKRNFQKKNPDDYIVEV